MKRSELTERTVHHYDSIQSVHIQLVRKIGLPIKNKEINNLKKQNSTAFPSQVFKNTRASSLKCNKLIVLFHLLHKTVKRFHVYFNDHLLGKPPHVSSCRFLHQ